MSAADALLLVVRATLVLLAAVAARRALRVAPPEVGHGIWASALVVLGLLPLTGFAAPRWQVAVPSPVDLSDVLAATQPARSLSARPPQGLPRETLALLFWAAGALATASPVGYGAFLAARLHRVPVDSDTRARVHAAAARIGIAAPRHVYLADVPVPFTYGWLRPRLVFPHTATAWPDDRFAAAALHELAHVARRDWAWQMFAETVRALWWFHPLAHHAVARLRADAESACDRKAIRAGIAPADFARHLLDIARSLRKGEST